MPKSARQWAIRPLLRCLLLAACLLPACRDFAVDAGPDPEEPEPADVAAELGVAFRLGLGQSARLEDLDLSVRFVSVTADSRCPRATDCPSAGQVGAGFLVDRGSGIPVRFQLWIPGLVDQPFLRGDVFQSEEERFRLLWIDPYPEAGIAADPDSVFAVLRVDHGI